MVPVYARIIRNLEELPVMPQPPMPQHVHFCRKKDDSEESARRVYEQFDAGLVQKYLAEEGGAAPAFPSWSIRRPYEMGTREGTHHETARRSGGATLSIVRAQHSTEPLVIAGWAYQAPGRRRERGERIRQRTGLGSCDTVV